jgi:hypothetical protein
LSAFDLSSCPLHVPDGLAVQAGDSLELVDSFAKTLDLCLGRGQRISGQDMKPVACRAEG